MKFLAFVNGELSATYFSSFANSKSDDLSEAGCLTGELGTDSNCKWKPWTFKDKVSNAKKVSGFKNMLTEKLVDQTKRSKVTQYICNLGNREEFEPLTGILCEKEIVKPLHLKNNDLQKLRN